MVYECVLVLCVDKAVEKHVLSNIIGRSVNLYKMS